LDLGVAEWRPISKDELALYLADPDFTELDPDNDGTVDADEFMAGCKGGLIKGAAEINRHRPG
jgi:hypothetical protein